MKTTNISIYLYGKPSWELDIEGKNNLDPEMFKRHGEDLRWRMYEVAETLDKLQTAGWDLAECYGALYSLEFYKDITEKEAKKQLNQLGIKTNLIHIEEWDGEEEYEEE